MTPDGPRRMKASFTTFDAPDFVGGPNSWLRRVVPRLRDAGWSVDVLFYVERGPAENCPCYRALRDLGIPCEAMASHEPMFEQVRITQENTTCRSVLRWWVPVLRAW